MTYGTIAYCLERGWHRSAGVGAGTGTLAVVWSSYCEDCGSVIPAPSSADKPSPMSDRVAQDARVRLVEVVAHKLAEQNNDVGEDAAALWLSEAEGLVSAISEALAGEPALVEGLGMELAGWAERSLSGGPPRLVADDGRAVPYSDTPLWAFRDQPEEGEK